MGIIAAAFIPQLFEDPERYDWLTYWGMLILPIGMEEAAWYRFFTADRSSSVRRFRLRKPLILVPKKCVRRLRLCCMDLSVCKFHNVNFLL